MENVVLTIHLILALLLIGVVLLQRSEGGGLGMGGGGGGVMSNRGAATALAKLTWIFAVCFIATSITLTVLASRAANQGSLADQIGTTPATTEAPAADAPATGTPATEAPATGADLLPPGPADAPAAPPAAEN
jgi:preprotein translocase subunit SecG